MVFICHRLYPTPIRSLPHSYRRLTIELIAALTIGDFIRALSGLVDKIRETAQELMDEGDQILARQQMILADTLHSMVDHLEKAYHDQMNATFDRMDQTASKFFTDLRLSIEKATDLEGKTARDISNLIQQTQDTLNQILDRFPFMNGSPVVSAARPKDLLFDGDATDLEIVGYHLIDSNLQNKKPDVFVEGVQIDASKVGVTASRLQVVLPDELRNRISIENTSCQPMRPFSVRVVVYFSKAGFLHAIRNKKQEEYTVFVPAGLRQYTATITCSFHPITTDQEYVGQAGGQSPHLVVDGGGLFSSGHKERTEVTVYIPSGTKVTSHNEVWTVANAESTKLDPPVQGSDFVTVSGWLESRGGAHGRAWGEIRLTVAYRGTKPVDTFMPHVTLPDAVVRQTRLTHLMAPSDRGDLSRVEVTIRFKGCSDIFDKVIFDLPKRAPTVVSTTEKGQFTITVTAFQIEILKN